MFGSRRTTPFWRPKKRLLELERALASERTGMAKDAAMTQVVAEARSRGRVAEEAKKKARFSEI